MANFFSDIAQKFKIVPEMLSQLEKTMQAQEIEKQTAERLKQAQQPPKKEEAVLTTGNIFSDIANQYKLAKPVGPIAKPASQLEKVLESSKELGEQVREKIGKPLAETIVEKAPPAVMEALAIPSKIAGGAVAGTLKPDTENFFQDIADTFKLSNIEKQPYLSEVVEKKVKETPYIGKIPLVAPVAGFLSEMLLPPYGLGGEAKFASKLAQTMEKSAVKKILIEGIKDITEQEAENLATKIAPITDKKIIQRELGLFAKNKETLIKGVGKAEKIIAPIPDIPDHMAEQMDRKLLPLENLTKKQLPKLQEISKSQPINLQSQLKDLLISGNGQKIVSDNSYFDPIKVITQALKEAKPIRQTQEALYSVERSKRLARLISVGKKVPGEKGYFAQIGQLKGEFPRAQFESIRNKISQPQIDELFNIIEKNEFITPFEKINAKSGLSKLLGAEGGMIPTKGELELLSEIFPKEFVKEILDKRPLVQKLWGGFVNALNLPRAIMATADLSAPLRQGIFLIGKPKQWTPAFKNMFKYAFSEKAYSNLTEEIKKRSTYLLMRENKLALTDIGENLAKREEQFMSNLVDKIPIFGRISKGSNRAYSGFLNKLRADVFDDLYYKALKLDIIKENPGVVSDIAKFVNSATGRGDLGALNKAATTLNGVFFSPRLIASRINLLNPVYYIKLDPFVRKEALKSVFTFASVGLTILGLTKLGGAEIGIDSRSADFGKIKIGNTRYDPWGGFQQYMVLISRLATGKMVSSTTGKEFTLGEGYMPTTRFDIIQRFFESKSSPVASFVLGFLKGKTTMGEEFKTEVEIAERFIPMLMQDTYDLLRDKGLAGILWELPGLFGVGSQTYTDLIPLESKTAKGKSTIKWRQQPNLGEAILNELMGTKIESLPIEKKYNEAQQFLKQGKIIEAKAVVDSLSDNDYALYKKFKERDKRIKHDEMKAKLIPLYKKNKKLIQQDKMLEAKMNIAGLTDEEYNIYKEIKQEDYRTIQP